MTGTAFSNDLMSLEKGAPFLLLGSGSALSNAGNIIAVIGLPPVVGQLARLSAVVECGVDVRREGLSERG